MGVRHDFSSGSRDGSRVRVSVGDGEVGALIARVAKDCCEHVSSASRCVSKKGVRTDDGIVVTRWDVGDSDLHSSTENVKTLGKWVVCTIVNI